MKNELNNTHIAYVIFYGPYMVKREVDAMSEPRMEWEFKT